MLFFDIHFLNGCCELLEEDVVITIGDLAKRYGHIRKARYAYIKGSTERFHDVEDLDNNIAVSDLLAQWRENGLIKDWVILVPIDSAADLDENGYAAVNIKASTDCKLTSDNTTLTETNDTELRPTPHLPVWPARASIEPLPVFELTATFLDWHQEALSLLEAEARAAVERRWCRLCDDNSRSLEEKVRMLLEDIIRSNGSTTRELYMKEIREQELARTLYGTAPSEERTVLLDLAPVCGLAVAERVDPHTDEYLRMKIAGAAYARTQLDFFWAPVFRLRNAAKAADNIMNEERDVLAPELLPVQTLVRVGSSAFGASGVGNDASRGSEDPFQAVRDMSVSLQALERATRVAAHEWALKGLVVESATSARLVLHVKHPRWDVPWECWASPSSEDMSAFVDFAVLAALANGRELADRMVLIDSTGNGPAWQSHQKRQARMRAMEKYEAAQVARIREDFHRMLERHRRMATMKGTKEGRALYAEFLVDLDVDEV